MRQDNPHRVILSHDLIRGMLNLGKNTTYRDVRTLLISYMDIMYAAVDEMMEYGNQLEKLAKDRDAAFIPIPFAFLFAIIGAGIIGFIVNIFVHVTSFMFGLFMIPGFVFYVIGYLGNKSSVIEEYDANAAEWFSHVLMASDHYKNAQQQMKDAGLVPYVLPANRLDPAWINLFIDYMDAHPSASMVDVHSYLQGEFEDLAHTSLNSASLIEKRHNVDEGIRLYATVSATYPGDWLSATEWFKQGGTIFQYLP